MSIVGLWLRATAGVQLFWATISTTLFQPNDQWHGAPVGAAHGSFISVRQVASVRTRDPVKRQGRRHSGCLRYLHSDFTRFFFRAILRANSDVLHHQLPGEFVGLIRHLSGDGGSQLPFAKLASISKHLKRLSAGWRSEERRV